MNCFCCSPRPVSPPRQVSKSPNQRDPQMERVTPRGMRAVSRSFEIELSHSMMVRTTSRAFLCDGARTTSFPVKHKTATLVGTPMLFSALRDQISAKTCLQAPIRFRKVDGGEEKSKTVWESLWPQKQQQQGSQPCP